MRHLGGRGEGEHLLLKRDEGAEFQCLCGNTQVLLSECSSARINTSPHKLFPPHYNLEIYLLLNRPSSARLHLESLSAASFQI